MSLITARGLAKAYGAQDVFQDVTLSIERGDRIALIGRNGEGKSTLLKVLAGLEPPTAGTVQCARHLSIGYLPQHAGLDSDLTLWEAMLEVFAPLLAQQEELRRLEAEMSAQDAPDQALLDRYGALLEAFGEAGGYEFEARIRQVLVGLGLGPEKWDEPVRHLSGGEKTRALLARLLLQGPDLLLLDEPTNHLDLQATEWLEGFLATWPGTLVLVAHDRYLLDRLATRVWELEFGRLETYRGNYTAYLEQRAARRERQVREWEAQQDLVRRTEEFVRRYGAGQRSKEARGRAKRLARLERVERPREARTMALSLRSALRSGDLVLEMEDLVVGYRTEEGEERAVLSVPEARVFRGECVALMGPNGSGKTSLLRTLMGEVPPLGGTFRLGASVVVGYLPQGHGDLDPEATVLESLLQVKDLPLSEARHVLGRYLFSGDDVFKPVAALSGGERSRLALARLALQGANFLILDEPTTHLDIPSREVLEEVLAGFGGTVLLVSHDRYLVDRLADQVWWAEGGVLETFAGTYAGFVAQREEARKAVREEAPRRERRDLDRARRKERSERARLEETAARLEAQVLALEEELAQVDEALAAASLAGDVPRLAELARKRQALEAALEGATAAWEAAAEALLGA
ncbi:MAG: ABC-F family ATP-binding cassette domain-containing protein [Anaerolineae bacterium]